MQALDPVLSQRLGSAARSFGVPGVAIALVAPGRRSLFFHGEIDAGLGLPVTESSWFSCASMGKHVTAAALLELAQKGRIDLQAPVGSFLQDLPVAWADRPVQSLLHHTSGLPEYLLHMAPDAVPGLRAGFMASCRDLQPVFANREAWMYSNTNYVLAGLLVAQVAGVCFAEAVQSLFVRMGVGEGAAVGSPAWARRVNQGMASGVMDTESAARQVIGDGDAAFTPLGAVAWLEGLLAGRVPGSGVQAAFFSSAPLSCGRAAQYGCGWFLERLQGRVLAHHAGHFDGWTAVAILDPERGSGAIAMCNVAPGHSRWVRALGLMALEGYAPGSTPLGLPTTPDDQPELGALVRKLLLRRPGEEPDLDRLAPEICCLAKPGPARRPLLNLWAGVEPEAFEFIEAHPVQGGQLRRYRIRYLDRTEHVQVGLTSDERLYWAWGL